MDNPNITDDPLGELPELIPASEIGIDDPGYHHFPTYEVLIDDPGLNSFQLEPNPGIYVIFGGDGNDTLISGGGNLEIFVGGSGNDTYIVRNAEYSTIIEVAGGGIDTVMSDNELGLWRAGNVENITLTGSANVGAFGNELDNVITGNSGNNGLYGAGGNDTLIGGGGNDTLTGGAGNDVLVGGSDSDTYIIGTNGNTTIVENAEFGIDNVISYAGMTQLGANVENLSLLGGGNLSGKGNALNNVITGNSSNNLLNGGGGKDTFDLSAGGREVIRIDAINLSSSAKIIGFGSDDVIDAPASVFFTQVRKITSPLPDGTFETSTYVTFNNYVAFNNLIKLGSSPDGNLLVSGYQVELIGYTGPVNVI